jgi:hypothetical protein
MGRSREFKGGIARPRYDTQVRTALHASPPDPTEPPQRDLENKDAEKLLAVEVNDYKVFRQSSSPSIRRFQTAVPSYRPHCPRRRLDS